MCALLHPTVVAVGAIVSDARIFSGVFCCSELTCDYHSVAFALFIAHSFFGILSISQHVGNFCPPPLLQQYHLPNIVSKDISGFFHFLFLIDYQFLCLILLLLLSLFVPILSKR